MPLRHEEDSPEPVRKPEIKDRDHSAAMHVLRRAEEAAKQKVKLRDFKASLEFEVLIRPWFVGPDFIDSNGKVFLFKYDIGQIGSIADEVELPKEVWDEMTVEECIEFCSKLS